MAGAAGRWVKGLAVLLLTGCSTVAPPSAGPDAECRALYRHTDRLIERAGARDWGPRPVPGFPYLRVNRFLASFRDEVAEPAAFEAWVERMASQERVARGIELANAGELRLRARLEACAEQLRRTELADPAARGRLRAAARVEDDYVAWWRVVGLYPLSLPLVAVGISRWHGRTAAEYALPLQALPVAGELRRWAAGRERPVPKPIGRLLADVTRDALGIPRLDSAQWRELFDAHAPVWEIDTAGSADLPAFPSPGAGADTGRPAEFRRLSYTRFGGQVLPQLNYVLWFPERPAAGVGDIYAGRLDGVDWRVTLGPDGEPWLYDAIHNCGCYHVLFPSRHLRLRRQTDGWTEPPLAPQPAPAGDGPLVLRVAAGSHHVQRLYRDTPGRTRTLAVRDYADLRSLPSVDGRRSLFGEHGIVPGSERPERFLLWPMGVRSPGAMRQWGRHATAFVGRRHFDDAHLLETLFEPVTPP